MIVNNKYNQTEKYSNNCMNHKRSMKLTLLQNINLNFVDVSSEGSLASSCGLRIITFLGPYYGFHFLDQF